MAAVVHRNLMDRAARLTDQLPSHERRVGRDFVVIVGKQQHPVSVERADDGYQVIQGGTPYHVITQWQLGEPLINAEINGRRVCFQLDRIGLRYRLSHRGSQLDALVVTPRTAELAQLMPEKVPPDLSKFLLSPMPGLLVRLAVAVGDEVKAGEELAVVEAMKMENSLRANEDGVVAKVMAEQGQSLVVDQAIIEFE